MVRKLMVYLVSIAFFASFISVFSTQSPIHAAAVSEAKVVQGVNFRTQPSVTSNVIRMLRSGEIITILDKVSSNWFQIKDSSNKVGYVSTMDKYIQLLPPSAIVPLPSTNATVIKAVSFRTGPSTNNERMRYLQKDEPIQILEKVNNYWYKVSDRNGIIGYVSTGSQYISTSYSEPSPMPSPKLETNAIVVKSVSFRTGPSTNSERMRYLQKGELIQILEEVNRYWYKASDRNGIVGYVSTDSQYINTSYVKPAPEPVTPKEASILAQQVIDAGMKYLGTPYEYASSRSNTSTFDCSDFVRQAFLDGAGITLPSNSRTQGDYVRGIGKTTTDLNKLKPGDILFFMSYEGSKASDYTKFNKATQTITHDAIYLGNGQILHTYSVASGGVRISELSGAWEYRFLFGGSAF